MERRWRDAKSFKRAAPKREPYDYVLIVCEGTKTEPQYLGRLRAVYGLSSLNVRVTPADGTDPMSIVNFAEEELKRDPSYDRVYCVFDQDGHPTFAAAMQRLAGLDKFYAIPSVPCFEVWILLHFAFSTAPIVPVGGNSAGATALNAVLKQFPEYKKGAADTFDKLQSRLDTALANSDALERHNAETGSVNPATEMHKLVDYLTKLKAA